MSDDVVALLRPKYDTAAESEEPAERLLWVYSASVRWLEADGQPNSTSTRIAERSQVALDEIKGRFPAETHLPTLHTPRDPSTVSDYVVEVMLLVRETWYLTWFSHTQPDWGEDDEAVVNSFTRYVSRVMQFNEKWLRETGDRYEPFCLMGAEDRWRWKGRLDADDLDESSSLPAPCRCEGCKKFNVVRIDH